MKRILPLMLAFLAGCGDGGTTGPDPDPVLVATTSLPEGLVGASYSVALAASGGTGSYGWSVSSGTLPPGLTLAAGGTISGTPSAPGTSSFTVRATSGTQSGTRDLSITIQAPEVVITTSALAGGSAGAAYSQTLAATGGTGVFTWTVLGGALPAGLTLSAAGVISGTPTAGGTSNFTVQASSGGRTATRSLSITIANPAVVVTTATLADGTVGTAYSQTLAASGGDGSYTWGLVSGGGTLPAGLTLFDSGSISGTPTSPGTSSFTVRVTSGGQSATRALTITVQQPAVTITTTTLAAGEVGVAYSQTLAASGGVGGFTWSMAGGSLPAGLTLSAAGTITGTPTTAGSSTFSVRATSGTQSAVASLTILVQPPPVTVTTSTLRAAVQGVPYADTLRATGGTGSYTWALTAGSLPAGLALSAGGVISGTPTAQGSSTFTVQATSGTRTDTQDLTLTVQAPALVITTSSLPAGAVGDPYNQALVASGGTGVYSWTLTAGVLPGGLALSTAGVISGSPTALGTFNFTVQVSSGSETVSRDLSITILAGIPAVTIATTSLPGGNVGEVYSATLTATGGTGTFTWMRISGNSLPAGLTLSTTGVISGTPTEAVTSTFTVQAESGGKTATKSLTIVIGAALTDVIIQTTSLPAGATGVAYSQTLDADGGTGTYTWTRTAGTLPSGLTLSSAGVISGMPTDTITRSFTVRAASASKSDTQDLTISVAAGPVTITTTTLTDATVNAVYTRTLAATGGAGAGTYVWADSASTLPAWLSLSAAGVLSGTPPAEGTFNFMVRATSAGITDYQRLTLVAAYPPVTITTTSLPGGTVNVAYNQTLAATGGSGSYTWAPFSGSLPGGLTLSSGGVISGNPSAPSGTFNFTVQATSGSRSDTQALSIVVQPAGGYAMYLNVGNNPTTSVARGNQISIPLNVDLTQQGTQNLASITLRVAWDTARFSYVNAPAGNWMDNDGSFASVTIGPATPQGYLDITGFLSGDPDPALTNFVLRTINLTAKATAPLGNTGVTATISVAANKDAQAVTVTPRNLTVTIN